VEVLAGVWVDSSVSFGAWGTEGRGFPEEREWVEGSDGNSLCILEWKEEKLAEM
jgi:hypothetical protein